MRRGAGEEHAYRLTRPVVLSEVIGAQETIPFDVAITERDIMCAWDGARWKPIQVFTALPNETYEVVVEYKDVFGNIFRTVHPRGIWTNPAPDISDEASRSQMMIRQDRPTPFFLTGRQVVTTPDLPPPPWA
jgi:hypothetical protein